MELETTQQPSLMHFLRLIDAELRPSSVELKTVMPSSPVKSKTVDPETPSPIFKALNTPRVSNIGGKWIYSQQFQLEDSQTEKVELFIHWGARTWVLQEVRSSELRRVSQDTWEVDAALAVEHPGVYGATLCLRVVATGELIWQGRPQIDDAQFLVREHLVDHGLDRFPNDEGSELIESVYSYVSFSRELMRQQNLGLGRHSPRELFRAVSLNSALRRRLSEYVAEAREVLSTSSSVRDRKLATLVLSVLERIGIGEVVLISPEGPHASAGGLSQVISGLLRTLSSSSVQTTLISVLYDKENGKRHSSSETLLRDGFPLDGKRLPLTEVGEVLVRFGPTKVPVSGEINRLAELRPVRVFAAESKNVRILLLHHERLADSLYANVWSDELIKRSIFLSQGALEILANPRFGVLPHLVITNDWMTGLVPALMQTHPRYCNLPVLREAGTVHIIHNGGKDYQGRFSTAQFGEDIFPLLGLDPHHYFGLSDPQNRSMLNFTAAALFHVREAILTVSKPYAEELLTSAGGDGLESLYRRRRRILFGISNGIDSYGIRRQCWELGFLAKGDEVRAGRFRDSLFNRRLPMLKDSLKREIQTRFNLRIDPEATLVCLVGRLAEQKGLSLLTDEIVGGDTALSLLLRENPRLQFIIAGPRNEGDISFETLEKHVKALRLAYADRLAVSFDFIPHREVIQITAASDLFLMPSRYEPGGITQLEALVVGTPVVARNVGGLQATLTDYGTSSGNAFLFKSYEASELYQTIRRAVDVLGNVNDREQIVQNAACARNDWSDRLPSYLALFRFIAGVSDIGQRPEYLPNDAEVMAAIRAV